MELSVSSIHGDTPQIQLKSLQHALSTAYDALRERDETISYLKKKIGNIELMLKREMDVNDHYNDMNIALKAEVQQIRNLLKVRVLPSAMQLLNRAISERDAHIQVLKNALHDALRLIPDSAITRPFVSRLKKIYQQELEDVER